MSECTNEQVAAKSINTDVNTADIETPRNTLQGTAKLRGGKRLGLRM